MLIYSLFIQNECLNLISTFTCDININIFTNGAEHLQSACTNILISLLLYLITYKKCRFKEIRTKCICLLHTYTISRYGK